MGRPPIGKRAMTDAERHRRYITRLRQRAAAQPAPRARKAAERERPEAPVIDPEKDLIEEPYPKDASHPTSAQRWHWSAGHILGDLIALQAFWTREFGPGWTGFPLDPEMATIYRQALAALEALKPFFERHPTMSNAERQR